MATKARRCTRLALLVLGIILGYTDVAHTYEVVLLDTTGFDSQSLNWQRYHPSSRGRGWREGSYTDKNGGVTRVYTVCNVASTQVNNWLRTPYIQRGNANRLYIDMRFTMRRCTKYPDPANLQQCKESFKLLYYEAESDFANKGMPTWDTSTYNHIDVVAADTTFVDINAAIINSETRSIAIGRRGVYFAFYDEGACTTLISVKIYYIQCPSMTKDFAVFPNTTTGPEQSSTVRMKGTCVNHAAIERQPICVCKGDGTWMCMDGGCKCMPGYEPGPDKKLCTPCPPGKYKWKTGSQACLMCPAHSHAPEEGSVECRCEEGHYRSINDDKSAPCSKPPSEVQELRVTYRDQSTVNLTWKLPMDVGGRRDLSYRLECIACDNSVHFRPKKSGFNTTKLSVTGLSPSTKYKFIIYAENGVSVQSGVTGMASIIVVTETAIPSKVNNLRVLTVGTNYVMIAWDLPSGPHSRIERYEVKYYPKHKKSNASSIMTTNQNATITNLALNTKYCFKVRGKTTKGWGEFSTTIQATTGHIDTIRNKVNTQVENNQMAIIGGASVAVLVCMIIVIIMVVMFLRRNHRACNEKNVSDCDTLQYSNVQCPPALDHMYTCNGGLTVPLFQPPGAYRSYVDPHTYEDPNQAVREFTKEIDASCIMIESVIGGGEFGDVCKGRLRVPGKGELTVAIKTLKAGASDKNRLDFLTEASIMGQFEDPNVIYLEGVVTKSQPIMIVTEYMANGSLDTFLRNNDGKLTVLQLVGMMRGIAAGQRYLSDMGYVHRDLAARNILVNENLVCKVADFGLSREIEVDTTEGAYTTKGGKIPVRWTAPEAIAYRKFTSASDVWSFGIVMWEVMSYGERPYWNWSNQDVIKAVDKGYRLPPPMDCAEAIHQLMLDCWQKERSHRPKFTAIVKTLDKLIRAPELLRKVAKARPYQYFDSDTPNLMSYTSIEEWLTSIKMDRYTQNFLQEGYNNMEQVSQITLKELLHLGVTLVGHQKKIMNSVQTLRAQISGAHVSEGFLV